MAVTGHRPATSTLVRRIAMAGAAAASLLVAATALVDPAAAALLVGIAAGMFAVMFVFAALHELAHYAAARRIGMTIGSVQIGSRGPMIRFTRRGVPWSIQPLFAFGGAVHPVETYSDSTPRAWTTVALAGPAANLAFAAAFATATARASAGLGLVFAVGAALNTMAAAGSLIPLTDYATDGYEAIRSTRHRRAASVALGGTSAAMVMGVLVLVWTTASHTLVR